MAADNKIYPVTVEGRAALDAELKKLMTVERPAVQQAIETARAHGDLKENAEYHAAKEKQSFIEGRIQYINSLASAQVIDPTALNYPHVVFGATVKLSDVDSGTEVTYKIVGTDEADVTKNKISIGSPIARALIGKKVGDEVKVVTPKGSTAFEVCGIEYR